MKNVADNADNKEWVEMSKNIHRAVNSLEICWKCQKVSECHKYVLSQTILVWMCQGCLGEMERPRPERLRNRVPAIVQTFPASGGGIHP